MADNQENKEPISKANSQKPKTSSKSNSANSSNQGCVTIIAIVVVLIIVSIIFTSTFTGGSSGGGGGGVSNSSGSSTTPSSNSSKGTSSSNDNTTSSVSSEDVEMTTEHLKAMVEGGNLQDLSKILNTLPAEIQEEVTQEADAQVLLTLSHMEPIEEFTQGDDEEVRTYVINLAKRAEYLSEYANEFSYVSQEFYDKNSEIYQIYNLINYMNRFLPTQSELENYTEGEDPELDEKIAICLDLLNQVTSVANGTYENNPYGKIYDVQRLNQNDEVHGFKVKDVGVSKDDKNRVTDVVLNFEGDIEVKAEKIRFSEMYDKYYMEYEEFPFEIVCDYLGFGFENSGIKDSSYIINEEELAEYFSEAELSLLKQRGSDYFYNGIPIEASVVIREMNVELHMDSENLNSMIVNIDAALDF